MPPKIRIAKQDIINTSLSIIRESGVNALNARSLATYMGCSTQPIFSNYSSMDELKQDVIQTAYTIYQNYVNKEIQTEHYPQYKATGMAYIRFAEEERELFKLLFMRDRSEEITTQWDPITEQVFTVIQKSIGLSYEEAQKFHLKMWIYVHGIATMLATSYLSLDFDTISSLITNMYEGLKMRYFAEEES